jgi:Flp pilus assembly protein TadG
MRHPRRGRGQALVEFALAFPILVLLILAVFDAGRAIVLYNSLTNAAREGARLAIVNQDKTMVSTRVQALTVAGGLANASNLNDLVTFRMQGPNQTDATANAECSPTMAVGCIAVVTARADWNAITPIVGNLIGPFHFVARSELPVELVCPNPTVTAYATSNLCPRKP